MAVRLLLLVGGQEDRRDGPPQPPLPDRLRAQWHRRAAPRRLRFHVRAGKTHLMQFFITSPTQISWHLGRARARVRLGHNHLGSVGGGDVVSRSRIEN